MFDYLVCPVCSLPLSKEGNAFKCLSRHSFDIASSGYVNLLKPGKKNNFKAGDGKDMIKARTDFFKTDAYKPICDKICQLVTELRPSFIIDAGCGEGYYTEALAKSNTSSCVLGIDMSKHGCEHGAKSAKQNSVNNLFYSVGSIFELPVKDSYADVIVNMFAPVADQEFSRVLKPGGYFIVASAGIDHLDGLKSALYSDVYKNQEKILEYEDFSLVKCENLKYVAEICGKEAVHNLFTMTPYYHRTSAEDKGKLSDIDKITTTIEVNFSIYKKN